MKKPAQTAESNPSSLITMYIEELGDWRAPILTKLRGIILKAGPEITEAWKWGHPVWEANGLLCVAGAFEGYVKLTFSRGAFLKDPKKLFNASLKGRTWRAINFHQGDKIDAAGVKELVREAVALNAISGRR